jgi:hypothetical protein
MRFLRFARRHPLALLGVIAIAFIGWIWRDAFLGRGPQETKEMADAHGPIRRFLPLAPDETVDAVPHTPGKGLAGLKPGMPRAEVEKLLGAPAAEHVYPATIADGRVTYHAAYEADLGPPPTIRPIRAPHRHAVVREPDVAGRTLVTLEFDATKPGHPLLGVHFPDPLF